VRVVVEQMKKAIQLCGNYPQSAHLHKNPGTVLRANRKQLRSKERVAGPAPTGAERHRRAKRVSHPGARAPSAGQVAHREKSIGEVLF
jgi:hypothetical protein